MAQRTFYTNSFFQEIDSVFSFLELKLNFKKVSGLARYHNGRVSIKPDPIAPSDVTDDCDLIVRYESEACVFEILYNNRDFKIDCYVIYQHIHRFALTDLMYLSPKTRSLCGVELTLRSSIVSREDIGKSARAIRDIITGDLSFFLKNAASVLNQAYEQKESTLKRKIQSTLAEGLGAARKRAHQSMHEGNYKNVIMMLRPYKDNLSPEDTSILSLALAKLDE